MDEKKNCSRRRLLTGQQSTDFFVKTWGLRSWSVLVDWGAGKLGVPQKNTLSFWSPVRRRVARKPPAFTPGRRWSATPTCACCPAPSPARPRCGGGQGVVRPQSGVLAPDDTTPGKPHARDTGLVARYRSGPRHAVAQSIALRGGKSPGAGRPRLPVPRNSAPAHGMQLV